MKLSFLRIARLFLISITISCQSAPNSYLGVSSEGVACVCDNYVKFHLQSRIHKFRFKTNGDYSISEGEEWRGAWGAKRDYGYKINISAGRKESIKVASWFYKKLEFVGGPAGTITRSIFPKRLNFGMEGTIHFEYENHSYSVKELMIAQGTKLLLQNWWIGGKYMLRTFDDYDLPFLTQELYSEENPTKAIKLSIKPSMNKLTANVFYLSVEEINN